MTQGHTPPPVTGDIQVWSQNIVHYLKRTASRLQHKSPSTSAAENGVIMWDAVNGYPVVSYDGIFRPLAYGDPMERYDAFGRLRVSNPATVFDSQLQYDKQPLLWHEKTATGGTATHMPAESAVDMTVTTASGASVIRQTKDYHRYQPGKSQQIFCTGVMGTAQANTNKLIGYGDAANGAFFGQDGGGLYVLLRSSVSGAASDARKVYQADWDGDTLDGTGQSRLTIDPAKTQIFTIDLEWLGVGQVRMGVVVAGVMITVHAFKNANLQTTTYMTTANLPVRYEITNTGAAAAPATLKQICCQVTSEGGVSNLQKYPFATQLIGVTVPNGAVNKTIVYAARHATTFNGVSNRGLFAPDRYEVSAIGGTVYSQVLYGFATTGAPTWAAVNANSFMEGASDIGTGFTGGTVIENGSSAAGTTGSKVGAPNPRGLSARLPFGLDIDGANPIMLGLALYATSASVKADVSFHWEEVR